MKKTFCAVSLCVSFCDETSQDNTTNLQITNLKTFRIKNTT